MMSTVIRVEKDCIFYHWDLIRIRVVLSSRHVHHHLIHLYQVQNQVHLHLHMNLLCPLPINPVLTHHQLQVHRLQFIVQIVNYYSGQRTIVVELSAKIVFGSVQKTDKKDANMIMRAHIAPKHVRLVIFA